MAVELPSFADGLGRRFPVQTPDQAGLESLRLCTEIADAKTTEAALIERVGRFAEFIHPGFAPVRRIERLDGVIGGLAVVSQAEPGIRLSDVLRQAERKWMEPDLNAAVSLIQQMTAAMSALHQLGRDASHGALSPERMVVRPDGTLAVAEYVLGPALERLQMGRTQLWTLFRVAVPAVAGTARFDQVTDLVQMGVVALSLVQGRLLHRDDYPAKVADLLQEAATPDPLYARQSLSRELRGWIARLLQLDTRTSFRTACEAEVALPAAIAEDAALEPSTAAVRDYVSRAVSDSELSPQAPVAAISDSTTVKVPHFRVGPGTGIVDRGSGAQRVAVVAPEPKPTRVRVLTEVAAARPPASTPVPAPVLVSQPARRDWRSAVRRPARIALMSLALVPLWGVTYLGARTYLGLPTFGEKTGTVVIESRPAGVQLAVDGVPSGITPATLQLAAGEHTLALTTPKGTTVLPLTVVAGTTTTERIEVRQGGRLAKRTKASRPAAAPARPQ